MKFPKKLFSATTLSFIFKISIGFNLIFFNKIALQVVDPTYLTEVVFYIHTLPLMIIFNTFGLKTLISKNQNTNNSSLQHYNELHFFLISFFCTIIFSSIFFFATLNQYLLTSFLLKFISLNLFISCHQLFVSILMGKKNFLSANFFGGMQMNGFAFGSILNLYLIFLARKESIINIEDFFNIIFNISLSILIFILMFVFSKIKLVKKKTSFNLLFKKAGYIFLKQLSDKSTFNLDLIFLRIFIGENYIYGYSTFSSIARLILTPRNIFPPILVPFITEAINSKNKNKLSFLRLISLIGSILSLLVFIFIFLFFNELTDFYKVEMNKTMSLSILIILSLANYISVVKGFPELFLIIAEQEKNVFWGSVYALVFFIISCVPLIYFFEVYGLLLAVFMFSLFKAIYMLHLLYKKFKISTLPGLRF